MNKDVRKPVILYNVITGQEQPENPDDMAFSSLASLNTSYSTNNKADSDEDSKVKIVAQVTQIPDEAIIVLLDISGSMEE